MPIHLNYYTLTKNTMKKRTATKKRKKKTVKKKNNKTTAALQHQTAIDLLNTSLLSRSQVEVPHTKSLTRTLLQNSSALTELSISATSPNPPPLPSTNSTITFVSPTSQSQVKSPPQSKRRIKKKKKKSKKTSTTATAAASFTHANTNTTTTNATAISLAAKARVAARFAAAPPPPQRKTKTSSNSNSNSNSNSTSNKTEPRRFHYLGGSLNLRAERNRRKELEERLVATQSAVQRSTEEMQPAVGVLLQSVQSLEQAAEEQQKLDVETGKALEGLQGIVSTIKTECDTKLENMALHFSKKLVAMEEKFTNERNRDKIAFTKLARSHQAELALLRSKYIAFHESTRKRLDSLPSAISKIRAEAHQLVEPLQSKLAIVSQAVGQLDQAVFDVDREQLRMKLQMRSNDPSVGSPARNGSNGFMNDSLDLNEGEHKRNGNQNQNQGEERTSVMRRLQKELRELVNEVARDRSTMRKRTDEQASKLSDLGGRVDSTNSIQQRANSELHELVTRITSVMRADMNDNLENTKLDLIEKIEDARSSLDIQIRGSKARSGGDDSTMQAAEMVNHVQATASRAAVDADEALRYAREAMAKIGSVDVGLAARVVQVRESANKRNIQVAELVDGLTRRVDLLSSEIAMQRSVDVGFQ